VRVKEVTDRGASLAQKIVEARTALMLLRQTHPHPRLTIALADAKLADQVTEMQKLSDEVQSLKQKIKDEKGTMKNAATELENLRSSAAEAKKIAKLAQVEEDDSRILPLYDW
jgi:molecular chaperone GrpE (heat shock protein)